LTKQIESLNQQLIKQETKANNTIQLWEDRLKTAEEDNATLREKLEEASSQLTDLQFLRESASRDEEIVGQWEARATELTEAVHVLEQQVLQLQSQLDEEEKEATNAISQWQETCSNLETKCFALEDELTHTNEVIASRDWSIEQLKSRNEICHLQIEQLKADLQVKPSIADDLLEATSEISRLTETLELERQARVDERETHEAQLADERGRHAEARDEIETLSASLHEIKAESESIINQWTGEYIFTLFSSLNAVIPHELHRASFLSIGNSEVRGTQPSSLRSI
jgi:chromosome segregation ATPase